MSVYLNAGCGTHYATGWVNVDVWENQETTPDIVVEAGEPYPFDDNHFDAVFLGHVLEHIPWPNLGLFLSDINRVAKPGAPVLAVGPDVYRTIKRWKEGSEPWSMVMSAMEHQDLRSIVTSKDVSKHEGSISDIWYGAVHHWNCHEERMFSVMSKIFNNCENYTDVVTCDGRAKTWHDKVHDITWPVVGYWHWQCAVLGYAT
jgi:predicted SAM-dependent methyltransferase